jgi:hypothetical protein
MWSGGHVVRDLPASGTLVLGRSDDADVVLDHPSVSRKHATITMGAPLRIGEFFFSRGRTGRGGRESSGLGALKRKQATRARAGCAS